MSARVLFAGCGATYPFKGRGLSGIAVKIEKEIVIFDCGEGFQEVFLRSGMGLNLPIKVFISHLHGDHVLGLLPLLQSLAIHGRSERVEVFGPRGLCEVLGWSLEAADAPFDVDIHEINSDNVYDFRKFKVKVIRARHNVEAFSFVLQGTKKPGKFDVAKAEKLGIPEGPLRRLLVMGKPVIVRGRVIYPHEVVGPPRPGFSLAYSGDTRPSTEFALSAAGVLLMVHEATYLHRDLEQAKRTKHSTAKEAAEVAKMASAGLLCLTHFSPRYRDLSEFLREAREAFRRSYLAKRGLVLTVNLFEVDEALATVYEFSTIL